MHGIESIIRHHPKGARVWVYYNPENPRRAVLEKGIRPELYGTPIGASILLALGVFFCRRLS